MGLEASIRGPFAALSINPTNLAVINYNVGFRPSGFVRNGVGDLTLTFQTEALVQAELAVIPGAVSTVFCNVVYDVLGATGIRVRCFDAAGAAFDPGFVTVMVWRVPNPNLGG